MKPLGKRGDGSVATTELLEHAASGGIGQCAERSVKVLVAILSHVVQYRAPRATMQFEFEGLLSPHESGHPAHMARNAQLEIAPFTPRHQPEVRALILAGLAERWEVLDESLNRDLDDIATSYATGRVLIAMRGGRVVGVGCIVPVDDNSAEIKRMSVASDERRSGVGAAIVDALLEVARSWSAQRVVCETSSHWSSAVEFYVRCGFRVDYEQEGNFGRDTYFSYTLAIDE